MIFVWIFFDLFVNYIDKNLYNFRECTFVVVVVILFPAMQMANFVYGTGNQQNSTGNISLFFPIFFSFFEP